MADTLQQSSLEKQLAVELDGRWALSSVEGKVWVWAVEKVWG
jgi:hypothetical protein